MNRNTLFLRLADLQDEELLLDWANNKTLRLNSFNTEEISAQTHKNWFFKILNSDSTKLFIAMNGIVPVGQIRLEITENSGIISYSIAENHRGLGYGRIIIELLEDWIASNFQSEFELNGFVKKGNEISNHIFETARYEKSECEQSECEKSYKFTKIINKHETPKSE